LGVNTGFVVVKHSRLSSEVFSGLTRKPKWNVAPVSPLPYLRIGAITREAWVRWWKTVLVAVTALAGNSMVNGSPVCG